MAAQAPEQFLEVEIKLAVDEGTSLPDLTQLPGVDEIATMREHNLSAVYYDTEDLRLTRSKITLRRRTGECMPTPAASPARRPAAYSKSVFRRKRLMRLLPVSAT